MTDRQMDRFKSSHRSNENIIAHAAGDSICELRTDSKLVTFTFG